MIEKIVTSFLSHNRQMRMSIKLDTLIQTGIISKDKVMYKYFKDMVKVLKYDHEYDPDRRN